MAITRAEVHLKWWSWTFGAQAALFKAAAFGGPAKNMLRVTSLFNHPSAAVCRLRKP